MESKVDVEIHKDENPLIIVPAAGFGTRVGSPMAKEMLPADNNQPMIQFVVDLAQNRQWPLHVITRQEKQNLIDYLKPLTNCCIQIVDKTVEWPHTILAARDYLADWNFLILPDTRFTPIQILEKMWQNRGQADVHYACFQVQDSRKWGVIVQQQKKNFLAEKCEFSDMNHFDAWGVILFKKEALHVFDCHLKSTLERMPFEIPYQVKIYPLDSFIDLGRPD